MGEKGGGSGSGGDGGYWWWAIATSAQLAMGVRSYRKGCDSRFMPFKAFAVASLFVGAGATAVAGFLHTSGIHKVEDVKEVGASIRKELGIPPRQAK